MNNFGFMVKVIEDSIGKLNDTRIITFQLRYPRMVHSEFMTHRMFSRNASSSRAIPVSKLLKQIYEKPAMPVHWGKNKPGMQAHEELEGDKLNQVQHVWKEAAIRASKFAEEMSNLGAHKQIVNRITEPFQFINVIVTATEWDNWFNLRDHEDAQPEIRYLAGMMKHAMNESKPNRLKLDQWHLPYIKEDEKSVLTLEQQIECSVARCARVSYLNHDGTDPDINKDLELYDRLVGSAPLHASPAEHQATPMESGEKWSKNFRGWKQFRELLEDRMENWQQ